MCLASTSFIARVLIKLFSFFLNRVVVALNNKVPSRCLGLPCCIRVMTSAFSGSVNPS